MEKDENWWIFQEWSISQEKARVRLGHIGDWKFCWKYWHLETLILVILEMPEDKNAAKYRRKVDATEENHGIAGKVFNYTTESYVW